MCGCVQFKHISFYHYTYYVYLTQVIIDDYITSAEDNALKALDAVVDINQTLDLQDVNLVSSLFTEDNSDCITPTSLAQADHPTAWKVKSFTPTILKYVHTWMLFSNKINLHVPYIAILHLSE